MKCASNPIKHINNLSTSNCSVVSVRNRDVRLHSLLNARIVLALCALQKIQDVLNTSIFSYSPLIIVYILSGPVKCVKLFIRCKGITINRKDDGGDN